MKLLLFCAAVLLSTSSFANNYYPEDIQKQLNSASCSENVLKGLLQRLLRSPHLVQSGQPDELTERCNNKVNCISQRPLSYDEARTHLFGHIHLERNSEGYYIRDVYCNNIVTKGVGPMRIPSHADINCEHTWPQSRFSKKFSKNMQKGDLHNLYPSDNRANSIRNSYHFAEVDHNEANNLCDQASLGSYLDNNQKNSHNLFFDPPAEHRGNVARALFYFSIRYDLPIPDEEEFYLRKWHEEDPVDADEIKRNNEIFNIQYNRNPFIDYPQIVSQISNF